MMVAQPPRLKLSRSYQQGYSTTYNTSPLSFPQASRGLDHPFHPQIHTAPGRADVSDTHIAGKQQYLGKVRGHKHQQQKLSLHLEVPSTDVVGLAFTDSIFPDMSANINPSATCTCVRLA